MKMIISRNSPGVQWLGLFAVTAKSSELGQGTRISQARRSNLPHPPKKIISKLNFRAVNFFFFKSRSEFKFESTLSRCESSGASWLRLGIRVGGSLCEQEEEEGG